MIYLFLIAWFGYWSAESGASLPWSSKWQTGLFQQLPECIIAITVGTIAVWGWDQVFTIPALYVILGWIAFIAIAYAGKQSATWAYLIWTKNTPRNPDRQSTLRPINDWIARMLNYKLGDEGYSWIWAATKGLIMTAPIGGTGVLFHPLGHEIGSHAYGRLPGDPNMWKEISGGAIGIGLPAAIFMYIAGML